MEFPYQYDRRYGRWFPIIPVHLTAANGRSIESQAYVDSGAAFSVFQPFEAKALGLDLGQGRTGAVTAGDGRVMRCAMFAIQFRLGSYPFKGEVGFSGDLRIGFNVLGLAGFFDQFEEIVFRHRARRMILRR